MLPTPRPVPLDPVPTFIVPTRAAPSAARNFSAGDAAEPTGEPAWKPIFAVPLLAPSVTVPALMTVVPFRLRVLVLPFLPLESPTLNVGAVIVLIVLASVTVVGS